MSHIINQLLKKHPGCKDPALRIIKSSLPNQGAVCLQVSSVDRCWLHPDYFISKNKETWWWQIYRHKLYFHRLCIIQHLSQLAVLLPSCLSRFRTVWIGRIINGAYSGDNTCLSSGSKERYFLDAKERVNNKYQNILTSEEADNSQIIRQSFLTELCSGKTL